MIKYKTLLTAAIVMLAATAQAGELLQDVSGTQLKVRLSAKQTRWMAGAPAEMEAEIVNSGTTPFRVDVFGELNALYQGKHKGAYIASCWTLAWEPQVQAQGPQPGKAPLSSGQLILLNPGQSHTLRLIWTVQGVPVGRYKVRLAYAPRVASPSFNFPEHWLSQQGIAEPIWTGIIFSEPVDIEVVPYS